MAGELVQYFSDHQNASACALGHYNGAHDITTCRVPAGYCSAIAYIVSLLKQSEAQRPAQPYPMSPILPVPPVTYTPLGDPYETRYAPPANAVPAGFPQFHDNGSNGSNGSDGQGGGGSGQ